MNSRPRCARILLAAALLLPAWVAWSAASTEVPLGKLPSAATPTAYRLDLTIVPSRERFAGHVEIDIVAASTLPSLFLHGRDLAMHQVTALSGGKRIATTWTPVHALGTARLDFAQPLPAGPATLVFDYDAAFGDDAAGLYRLKVGEDWYAWTQFQSIDARGAFPSFDEPGYKTPFTVSLTTQPGLLALSNAPETGSPVAAGELVTHRFAPTLPLPTYLMAFVVGPFITVEGVAPATRLRNWPLPLRIVATRNHAGRLDYALRETPRIVELLEDYFGQPFPFPKLDQIASPVMPGAMENAGADIYGDNILLLEEGASTVQRQQFGAVVAHELSHQWFGDLVTPAWWDDLWLNESFANWLGYRVAEAWRPDLNAGVYAVLEAVDAMDVDALQAGRPIREPVLDSGQIDSAFDAITYGKGGQIIAMIASFLGDARFQEGVRLHMRRRPYGNATTDDFFEALASAAGDPRVLTALREFVDQQGIPLVDVVREGDRYRLTQTRYANLGGPDGPERWNIPFCARRGTQSTCRMIDEPTLLLDFPGTGPLIPNAGGTGYYRYFLSQADWQALLAAGDSLTASEALTAIDSLWSQFTAGRLDFATVLRAARQFAGHADSNVAIRLGTKLQSLSARALLPAAARPDFARFMTQVYARQLAAIGFDPTRGAQQADSPDRQKFRQQLVSLVIDATQDVTVRQRLDAAAVAWLAGDEQALDPAFYRSAFTAHLRVGGVPAARVLFERLLTSGDELFRSAAIDAIGGSAQPAVARWILARFEDPRLRSSDQYELLSPLMGEWQTRDAGFDWLQHHFAAMVHNTGLFAVAGIAALPEGYCSKGKAAEIERLLAPAVRATGRGDLPFRRMLERVSSCGALSVAAGADIGRALRQGAATP